MTSYVTRLPAQRGQQARRSTEPAASLSEAGENVIDETEVLMMTMIDILKEVGRGKRGARDLNYSEALAAAESIIDGTATPAQIGAFFVAERMKMESAEELEAFVNVLRERTYRSSAHAGLDCAGPYDGRKSSFTPPSPLRFCLPRPVYL